MHDRIILGAAISALVLSLGSAAHAQDSEWWSDWDTDGDGQLTQEEFSAGYSESDMFSEIDTDQDEMYSEQEVLDVGYMSSGAYRAADGDQDGMLTEDELMDAIYANWDADDSGTLDSEELTEAGDAMGMTEM
jgi:Ca2+-binding EF-hand superfamily protein